MRWLSMRKKPFDIDVVLERIHEAVAPFPKAALFELYDDGYVTPFEILVACIISIRTRDEVTVPTAKRLFDAARTPASMVNLSVEAIDALINDSTFHYGKAQTIHALTEQCIGKFHGELPCDFETLTGVRGVGPKCANLVLGIACGLPVGIGVDIHVHRVTNRWGYVEAPTPERTMAALESRLPKTHWVEINALLVPFGKHVCTGVRPKCSTCPVNDMCRRVGVTDHR